MENIANKAVVDRCRCYCRRTSADVGRGRITDREGNSTAENGERMDRSKLHFVRRIGGLHDQQRKTKGADASNHTVRSIIGSRNTAELDPVWRSQLRKWRMEKHAMLPFREHDCWNNVRWKTAENKEKCNETDQEQPISQTVT